jgi:hypothetical protein
MRTRHEGLSQRLEALIEKLPANKQASLRELLLDLLEPMQRLQIQRDGLRKLEEKYLVALEEDSKVVEIHSSEPKAERPTPVQRMGERRWFLKTPSLIESPNPGESFRLAFELHMRSSRSIFLSWRDLDPAARLNPIPLLELSGATIFVSDITTLNLGEQRTILAVIRKGNQLRDAAKAHPETPHIMAATRLPFSELQRLSSLDHEFLDGISEAYLKLTKPVATYKREGLIRYFLESLS